MGCDIHLSIEYRYDYEEEPAKVSSWWCWGKNIAGVRDYDMFGYLAGVRNYSEYIRPIVKPRGIPKDVGFDVKDKVDEFGTDGHSHTWLYPNEYIKACALTQFLDEQPERGRMAKEWIVLRDVLNSLSKHYGEKNVRLIMFFDS